MKTSANIWFANDDNEQILYITGDIVWVIYEIAACTKLSSNLSDDSIIYNFIIKTVIGQAGNTK